MSVEHIMARVRIEKVTKRFGRFEAVKEFSMQIDEGEFIVLVGPSGCGKTTLLRMIAGLEKVSGGDIFIDDIPVTNTPPKRRDIAMVFQNYALYPHMTVYNNLAFSLKLRKFSREQIRENVTRTAEMLGLADLLHHHPNQLSGGQKQRVALGRAIIRDPKVFLFDEPLSNLDAKLRVSMRAEIMSIHRRLNNTSIYVTHDQLEAMTMGTLIVVMKDGMTQQIGTPGEIYNRPANRFVAGFIGSPAMNMIGCGVEEDGRLFVRGRGLQLTVPEALRGKLETVKGRELFLGIRPESFIYGQEEAAASSDGHFEARVTLVEPLGSEQLVHFSLADNSMIAKLDPRIELKYGDKISLGVRMEDVNFFYADNGENIAMRRHSR
jgi:multiple sugar transport system ATP-binding protein